MVCYFSPPNSPIFQKSPREEEDGEKWQMQSVLLFKQTQNPTIHNTTDSAWSTHTEKGKYVKPNWKSTWKI